MQMFVEAKRHQPSIIFIPSLAQWSETLSETARSTTRALLDGISPSDPVLLLAIVDGPLDTLPGDVRAWFGFSDENRIQLGTPSLEQRGEFFEELIGSVQRPPTAFPDGVTRKKRVLEELPLAAPLPPRKPTEAEIQRELEREGNARNMLYISFSTLISEFCRKYRRPIALVRVSFLCRKQLLMNRKRRSLLRTTLPSRLPPLNLRRRLRLSTYQTSTARAVWESSRHRSPRRRRLRSWRSSTLRSRQWRAHLSSSSQS